MPPAEILRMLRQQPFLPFRLHLADGRTFDVRHPDFCMIGVATVAIGLPDQGAPEL
jgi:hypothetical protein